jgi:hypothetical protein
MNQHLCDPAFAYWGTLLLLCVCVCVFNPNKVSHSILQGISSIFTYSVHPTHLFTYKNSCSYGMQQFTGTLSSAEMFFFSFPFWKL